MNILLVSPLPPPEGGIATWTLKYQEYCEEHNENVKTIDISLIGLRGEKINKKRSCKDEIRRTISITSKLKSVIKDKNLDLAHLNTSCSKYGIIRDCILINIIKKRGIPVVIECHCNLDYELSGRIKTIFFKHMCNKAQKVLVLNTRSYEIADSLCKSNVIIVPNFINKSYIAKEKQINKNLRKVVFVGHVQFSKGCKEIFAVANKLVNIQFYLLGPVNNAIRSIQKPDNVHLEGARVGREVKKYLHEADVFLFPSYTEGFSMAMLEAMASGVPIIASDVGANRDMIENHGGIIVQSQSEKEILDAFEKISDKSIRTKMSLWNIKKVTETYTTDVVMEKMFKIYKEILWDQ